MRSFWPILRDKTLFSKTLKISAPNSFFPKNDKNLLFNGGLFQQVLLTWNENLCERSKKIEVEDRIQKTDGADEETVFGLPGAVRSLRIFEEVGGGFGKKNLQGWERRSSGKFTILLVFLRKRRRWAFSLFKAARCQPFLAVFRCLFHNHLRLKRSSLLNVYLNFKFEIILLTSHLFFRPETYHKSISS